MPPTPNLPTPDFTFDPNAPGACIAGVRPFRKGSYRLEAETIGSKFIVHNYGHGGAGITLSWGCAAKVADLVKTRVTSSHDTKVAVLGAGVMGMTAASRLLDLNLGLTVTIYAKDVWQNTTSAVAGGQWAVSKVNFKKDAAGKEQLRQILVEAFTTIKNNSNFGVSELPNFNGAMSPNLETVLSVAPGLLPPRVDLDRLPFDGPPRPGFKYMTLLVEPPIFLSKLDASLHARGVQFKSMTFKDLPRVLALSENIIVNCTGFGSKALFGDNGLVPIKGQLARLHPQLNLQYLFGRGDGYLFPRKDAVIVGGTFEMGTNNTTPSKAKCKQLVEIMKSNFGLAPKKALPAWHIHHPQHDELMV
jgi:glycine/D-amino acid oxidase-like deaminating enzyme